MTKILADIALFFVGMGCFWLVRRTPAGSSLLIDGTLVVVGLTLLVTAVLGLLGAAVG